MHGYTIVARFSHIGLYCTEIRQKYEIRRIFSTVRIWYTVNLLLTVFWYTWTYKPQKNNPKTSKLFLKTTQKPININYIANFQNMNYFFWFIGSSWGWNSSRIWNKMHTFISMRSTLPYCRHTGFFHYIFFHTESYSYSSLATMGYTCKLSVTPIQPINFCETIHGNLDLTSKFMRITSDMGMLPQSGHSIPRKQSYISYR